MLSSAGKSRRLAARMKLRRDFFRTRRLPGLAPDHELPARPRAVGTGPELMVELLEVGYERELKALYVALVALVAPCAQIGPVKVINGENFVVCHFEHVLLHGCAREIVVSHGHGLVFRRCAPGVCHCLR